MVSKPEKSEEAHVRRTTPMVVSCMWGLAFWTLLLIHMSDAGHAQISVMIRLVSYWVYSTWKVQAVTCRWSSGKIMAHLR